MNDLTSLGARGYSTNNMRYEYRKEHVIIRSYKLGVGKTELYTYSYNNKRELCISKAIKALNYSN